MNIAKQIAIAWKNATDRRALTPLLLAIKTALDECPGSTRNFDGPQALRNFSKRIATAGDHCHISALDYHRDWIGEWTVTNADLNAFSDFVMWLHRGWDDSEFVSMLTGSITKALENKRMWQAFARYEKSGLTQEHCGLLAKMLWTIDTSRGDWISLYVQGKRPFGDSSIAQSIFEHAGWPFDWPEDDGMSKEQEERAWDLFDELAFAAPDAAKLASKHLPKTTSNV